MGIIAARDHSKVTKIKISCEFSASGAVCGLIIISPPKVWLRKGRHGGGLLDGLRALLRERPAGG
ncbi:hypothetical protein [Microbispora sp. CA-102843]|uniref:hypothetical protein n=1 Tax=Microbispora sp. CA-102843 TaxID=3239952 RepID=UPI003D8B6F8C